MDREIVYPGAIPLSATVLQLQKDALIALGFTLQGILGTSTIVDGLACAPTSPASMSVTVGAGSICQNSVVDQSAFGEIAQDTAHALVKMGINLDATTFALTAPSTPGQSINYLIEASLLEADATPVVLPYYNAANPAQPYTGPNNSGVAQDTQRLESVQLQLKAGAPAATGTQGTPAVDSGWVGLYVITVNYGATTVVAGNISQYASAPYLPGKLPNAAFVSLHTGNPNGAVAGNAGGSGISPSFVVDISVTPLVLYMCTTTGNASSAVWTAVGGSGGGSAPTTTDFFGVATGPANTYVVTTTPSFATLVTGTKFRAQIPATNTGASTINPNAIGATTIIGANGSALQGGELVLAGEYEFTYDANALGAGLPALRITASGLGSLQVTDPTQTHHAATKNYVDGKAAMLGERQISHSWGGGALVTNGTYVLIEKSKHAGTLDSGTYRVGTAGGSFAVTWYINGVAVTGLSAITVNSNTTTETAATGANAFSVGDKITYAISSTSGNPTDALVETNMTVTA